MLEQKDEKHKLSVGEKDQTEIKNSEVVGIAYRTMGRHPIYKIHLNLFPNQTFYMRKDKRSADQYTIFSRMVQEENFARLFKPVGRAYLSGNFQNYIEIKIAMLSKSIFMSLHPC